MSKKELIHKSILYIIIGLLILSNIWLFSLYSMQKEVIETYKEKYIEEHIDENGKSINNN